jgi:2-polyprenyl-6-methoxyphenol hydroxylase-like FAD-dependent oxidoreductase
VEVAVLGAGNGGCAVAFDWAQHGHNVRLFATAEYPGDDPAGYESRVSLNIGKTRDVLVSYAANPGRSLTSRRHSSLRSSPVTSVASTGNVAVPTSTMIRGCCLRLWYQSGCSELRLWSPR